MLTPDEPRRILIVRLSAIGDVLHGLPVLNALRDARPRDFIAWVVEGRSADILRSHKALDELIVLPRRWLKSPREVLGLRRRLRGMKFDITIDLQGLSKSAIAAWLSGARTRIGFGGPEGREISPWLNHRRVTATARHVVERNLELLGALGIAAGPARFDLEDLPSARIVAQRTLQATGLVDRFAVINPGAGWPSKLWPAARYGHVAGHLGRQRGLRSLVVWAGAQEQAWARDIVAAADGFATLAPATSLPELAAIVRRATLFIGSDTGPLHLAAAVGTPCVGLFGPVRAERNGPYGPQHVAVQKICLTGSSRQRRTADGRSMAAISVEHVLEACQTVLDRAEPVKRSA